MYETPSPPFSGWRVICAHKSGSSVHTDPVHLYTHFGFICTHISGSSVHTELSGDGVGWANKVHVPVHTQAQQPYHLSCCPADTGTTLGWSVTGGVGWGNNVHVPVHTQAHQTSWLISYRWGGVGWGNNVQVPEAAMWWDEMRMKCDEMRWDEMKRGREEGVRCHEMLVCPVQGPQPFPIGTCPLNICNPIGFYLGTLRPPTSWFAACKWWMMPVISCRLWII